MSKKFIHLGLLIGALGIFVGCDNGELEDAAEEAEDAAEEAGEKVEEATE